MFQCTGGSNRSIGSPFQMVCAAWLKARSVNFSLNFSHMYSVNAALRCIPPTHATVKVGFHYPSSRPELTGVKKCTRVLGPSTQPVNSGRELG